MSRLYIKTDRSMEMTRESLNQLNSIFNSSFNALSDKSNHEDEQFLVGTLIISEVIRRVADSAIDTLQLDKIKEMETMGDVFAKLADTVLEYTHETD